MFLVFIFFPDQLEAATQKSICRCHLPLGGVAGGGRWIGVRRPRAMLPNLACISSKSGFGLLSALLQSRTWVLAFLGPGRNWRRQDLASSRRCLGSLSDLVTLSGMVVRSTDTGFLAAHTSFLFVTCTHNFLPSSVGRHWDQKRKKQE